MQQATGVPDKINVAVTKLQAAFRGFHVRTTMQRGQELPPPPPAPDDERRHEKHTKTPHGMKSTLKSPNLGIALATRELPLGLKITLRQTENHTNRPVLL